MGGGGNLLIAAVASNVLFSELNEENSVPTGTWRPGTAIAPGTRPANLVGAPDALLALLPSCGS